MRIESRVGAPGATAVGEQKGDVQIPASAREDRTGRYGAPLLEEHGVGHPTYMLPIRQGCAATSPNQFGGIDADPAQGAEALNTQAEGLQPLDGNERAAASSGSQRCAERRDPASKAEQQLWEGFNDGTPDADVRRAAEVLGGRMLHSQ